MTKQRNYYQLNENERIIDGSDVSSLVFDRGGFILTNQRLIKIDRTSFGGTSSVHTFNLERIDSIQNKQSNYWWVILFGIVAIIIGIYSDDDNILLFSLLVLLITLLIYAFSRKRIITIYSGRTEMILEVHTLSHQRIQELVFAIEEAKQECVNPKKESLNEIVQESLKAKKSSRDDVEMRLNRLQDLLDKNFISMEEYKVKKQEILNSL